MVMPRSDRLFRLLDALRRLPPPATAARLAAETGVSERTIYRDIETLRAGGALIDGAPGYGYALTEDPALPPQRFSRLELQAVVLGLAEVGEIGDRELAQAAATALAKLTATLSEAQQLEARHAILLAHRWQDRPQPVIDMGLVRRAIWDERALALGYQSAGGAVTSRRVWPLSVAYLDHAQVLLAHCRLRMDFRTFRLDRIRAAEPTDERFRPRRVPLLRDFVARLSAGGTS